MFLIVCRVVAMSTKLRGAKQEGAGIGSSLQVGTQGENENGPEREFMQMLRGVI